MTNPRIDPGPCFSPVEFGGHGRRGGSGHVPAGGGVGRVVHTPVPCWILQVPGRDHTRGAQLPEQDIDLSSLFSIHTSTLPLVAAWLRGVGAACLHRTGVLAGSVHSPVRSGGLGSGDFACTGGQFTHRSGGRVPAQFRSQRGEVVVPSVGGDMFVLVQEP